MTTAEILMQAREYKSILSMIQELRDENHYCGAKVFTKETDTMLKKKIGCPDLLILLTNTVSYRMVNSVVKETKRNNLPHKT